MALPHGRMSADGDAYSGSRRRKRRGMVRRMKLDGKIALITGGAGGIGGETARRLAAEGATVIVSDLADAAGQSLASEIDATFFHHDVSSDDQWELVVQECLRSHGQIDVLVNAAGIEGDLKAAGGLSTSLAEWRRVMSINLDGTFLGCRHVVPRMLESGGGSIINLSSIVSYLATPTGLAYGASKAAVEQLTRSIAWIGAQDGKKVRCNSVHPGVIRTRMTDNIIKELAALQDISEQDAEHAIVEAIPFKARGTTRDVADLILFLASDQSAYITGSAFKVDGGWSIISAG